LSILWIDAICGSVQNSMTPPEKNVVRRVGKPTLYERGCHRPIFPHHWLKQSACQMSSRFKWDIKPAVTSVVVTTIVCRICLDRYSEERFSLSEERFSLASRRTVSPVEP
jgi:hypothetical protein